MRLAEDRYVKVGDLNVRYWDEGNSGPVLFLIHGIAASCDYWYHNIFELSKHCRVIAVDMPGFGKSDKPDIEYSLSFFSQFLKDFLDALDVHEVYVGGHSLGGGIALQFVIDNLSQVKKLALFDSVGFSKKVSIFYRLLGLPILGKLLLNFNRAAYAKALRMNVYHEKAITEDFVDVMFPQVNDPGTKRATLDIAQKNTNLLGMSSSALKPLWDRYSELSNLPMMVLWGKQDNILSEPVHLPKVQQYFPHADVSLLSECGHIPQMEYPEIFNEKVLKFIQG